MAFSKEPINFLDVNISQKESALQTDLYCKSTDTHHWCATRHFSGQVRSHEIRALLLKHQEKRALQGNILEFFLLDTLKTTFLLGNSKMDTIRTFFTKSGYFFLIFEIGQQRPPASHPLVAHLHQFLHFRSCHCYVYKKSILYGQAIQMKRTCSNEEKLSSQLKDFEHWFWIWVRKKWKKWFIVRSKRFILWIEKIR